MKKLFYGTILLLCAVWVYAQPVPQFVEDAYRKAPEDALIGVGTAKMPTLNMSRTIAAARARAAISRQLTDMIPEPAFQETINETLSQSKLQGVSIIDENIDDAGIYWVVVMLSRADTVKEIDQALAAAKVSVR